VNAPQIVLLMLLVATLRGQEKDFSKAYPFTERKPKTKIETAIDRLLPSIVKVQGASGFATIESSASGLIVSKRGHILTLDQVLLQKGRTHVVLYDGSVHQAQLLPEDSKLGVRLLKIDPSEVAFGLLPVWPVVKSEPAWRTGQFVVSIGNCFRLAEFAEKMSVTFGIVVGRANTALRYRLSDVKYDGDLILTDACNNQGHYGGGLFDLNGNWLGINTRLLESTETNTMLSAAIPARDLLPYLDDYVNDKAQPEAGAANLPVFTGLVLFQPAGRQSPPAYVDRVVADSPAAKAGLKSDDLIVRLDDYSIRTCKELGEVLKRYAPGKAVQVTYKRGESVLQVTLELAAEKQ
jgi:S1-C subfamily serine protease